MAASPFVCGFLRPRIYLPISLKDSERGYIVLHEKTHIRRRDYILKPVWYLAACLHWFNPLAWVSYALVGRDIEMSCDEAVIRKMGDSVRADYSSSLLALSGRRLSLAPGPWPLARAARSRGSKTC
jgi:beta-lactamase regulating signal transducer with metallopeptidase domain